jgi:hypothetical protein
MLSILDKGIIYLGDAINLHSNDNSKELGGYAPIGVHRRLPVALHDGAPKTPQLNRFEPRNPAVLFSIHVDLEMIPVEEIRNRSRTSPPAGFADDLWFGVHAPPRKGSR